MKIAKNLDFNSKIGLMVHMACCISKLVMGENTPSCYAKDTLIQKYTQEFKVIKSSLEKIEKAFNINFSNDEICFILKNIMMI